MFLTMSVIVMADLLKKDKDGKQPSKFAANNKIGQKV
jgi:hypothetical protein